ncbi:carbohydrate-binding protein [Segetibacter sp. 3557_3]|uniref:carbohydrate-binding protein n=1 Tax=Segetibacter sp. 3557_3 TaxID=2547429 RepID=UPI001A9E877B|nr:carbohydrate-binding protein [Segetibacter sp. 3557_3]
MEIQHNQNYQALLNYMRGQGQQPSRDEAFRTLMQLTENIKAENTLVHKDVLDAMFRQVQTTATIPFANHVLSGNVNVFATDYDLGRNGEAYHDKDTADYHVSTGKNTPGNKGRTYRNDGVDIERCSDQTTNGYQVSSFEAGEWMQYTVMAPSAAQFKVSIRVQSLVKGTAIGLSANGKAVIPAVVVDKGNSDSSWKTISIGNVRLSKGLNKLRLAAVAGEARLNYLQFSSNERASSKRQQKSIGRTYVRN